MKYVCGVCGYVYDEEAEGVKFDDLADDWGCPVCRAPKAKFAAQGTSLSVAFSNEFARRSYSPSRSEAIASLAYRPNLEGRLA